MDTIKKYHVMVVSNSIEYANQLKRCARLNNSIVVDNVVTSATELRKNINHDIDVYLISNSLANGDSLSDVIGLLQATNAIVFGILTDDSQTNYLDRFGIDYCMETDYGPMELIEFLEESLSDVENNEETADITPQPAPQPQPVRRVEPVPTPMPEHKEIVEPLPQPSFKQEAIPVSEQRTAQPYKASSRGKTTMGLIKNKIVSFTSSKGGVGKSSISIEVASCLAQRARQVAVEQSAGRGQGDKINVVLVDFNFAFGTIPSTLDCVVNSSKPVTLTDWAIAIEQKIMASMTNAEKKSLQGETSPNYIPYLKRMRRNDLIFSKQEILSLLIHDESNDLYILPTVSSPFEVDGIKKEYISIIIEELSRVFDIIIIDTGNNLSHFTSEAYYLSDEIYVVAQPLISVGVILKQLLISAVSVLGVDKEKFRLIMNHPNESSRGVDAQAMEQSLGIPLVAEIPYDAGVGYAHESGYYYAISNRKKRFSHEVALLANRICPLWDVTKKPQQSRARKWFGK